MFYALDLETKTYAADHPEYMLQPWRLTKGQADIALVMTYTPSGAQSVQIKDLNLAGQYVWTWNGLFDIAWLIAAGVDCSNVRWLDAKSAAKWVLRSQDTDLPNGEHTSWSLHSIAKKWLVNWGHYAEFMAVKTNVDWTDIKYLKNRCALDTEATYLLGQMFWAKLTSQQRKSFLIEQDCLYPYAQAWINGCKYDFIKSERLEADNKIKIDSIVVELKISKTILNSPQKLADLVYNHWIPQCPEVFLTEKGQKSISKVALTFLLERYPQDRRLQLLKQYRNLVALRSKFIENPKKTREYLSSDILHHQFNLNSTYTGRTTVSSKVKQ